MHRNLACVIDKSSRGAKLERAFEELPKGKTYNRRMSGWAKGSLTGALKTVFLQRGVYHDEVNAAYTSQIDSRTKRLEGTRKGDRFTGVDGVVLQAGSVRISVSGEVIPGAAQRGCPLYLRCSMPDLMR